MFAEARSFVPLPPIHATLRHCPQTTVCGHEVWLEITALDQNVRRHCFLYKMCYCCNASLLSCLAALPPSILDEVGIVQPISGIA
jgi:hypothetical protein